MNAKAKRRAWSGQHETATIPDAPKAARAPLVAAAGPQAFEVAPPGPVTVSTDFSALPRPSGVWPCRAPGSGR